MSTPGSFAELLPSVESKVSKLEFWEFFVFMQDVFPTVLSTTALIAALTILSSTVVVLVIVVVVVDDAVVIVVVVNVVVVDVVVSRHTI